MRPDMVADVGLWAGDGAPWTAPLGTGDCRFPVKQGGLRYTVVTFEESGSRECTGLSVRLRAASHTLTDAYKGVCLRCDHHEPEQL